jgi:ribosomal protein L29
MKTKQFLQDARAKSQDERNALILELREKFRVANIEVKSGKTKNPAPARELKKNIARLMSVSTQESRTNSSE